MLAEACATRRPVFMFDLGPDAPWEVLPKSRPQQWRRPGLGDFDRLKAFVYRQMLKVPPRRMTRDIRLVHRFLMDTGRAVWLGEPFPEEVPSLPDEMTPTVERIRALFGDDRRVSAGATREEAGVPVLEAAAWSGQAPFLVRSNQCKMRNTGDNRAIRN